MKFLTRNIFVTFILGIAFVSCKRNEVDGIFINHTLYESQSNTNNRELRQLIKQTLNKEEKALAQLIDFWCGDGAGCYDLGFIITQIIYRLGETEFMTMVAKLNNNDILGLEGLVMAGLEYGDNDKDGKMDNNRFENEYPELLKQIKANRQNKKPNL